MKRIIFIILGILLVPLGSSAQTYEQYTMWNQNHFLLNPGAAGSLDYFEGALGYRRQWAGIKEAPASFYATGHTVLNRPKTHQLSALRISSTMKSRFYNTRKNLKPYLKHAIGGQMHSSQFGAFEKTEANLSYAMHLPIRKDLYWSFGVSAGFFNFGFDQSKASVLNAGDQVFDAYVAGENTNQFNANAGTYLYSVDFFLGYSAHHLLQNELDIAEGQNIQSEANLSMRHYFMGGYNWHINNYFVLTPNILYKMTNGNPSNLEAGATLTYSDAIYLGANYRGEDAVSILAGVEIYRVFKLGYAYDYTTSELSTNSSGSHEIFLGFTLF